MPRRKKKTIPPLVIKIFGSAFLALLVGFACYTGISKLAKESDYFTIKKIIIDASVPFVRAQDLARVKGKNIFTVDLEELRKKLSYKYPQVSDLKVIKNYPDQISVMAQKRLPFAQTQLKDKVVTLDDKGVVLSTTSKLDKKFPQILGLKSGDQRFSLGLPLKGWDAKIALNVIKSFQENRNLSTYQIMEVDVQNLSKINLYLSNKLNIFIDRDRIDQKIKVLSLVLSRGKFSPKEVKYIDLRFKEPIIGKKQ